MVSRSDTKRRRKDGDTPAHIPHPIEESPKRAKVHAQRKFAQGSANMSSPVVTPAKDKAKTNGAVATPKLIPSNRPKTEDFLTFLCFRGTPVLPPRLDFFNVATVPENIEDENCPSTSADCSKDSTRNSRASSASVSGSRQQRSNERNSTDQVAGTSRRNYRHDNEAKKKSGIAVQALRKKYQEQRLAHQRVHTLNKLAQKVKGKNMVRTRSATHYEELVITTEIQVNTPKTGPVRRKKNIKVELRTKKVTRVSPQSQNASKVKGKRRGLRSGGQLPAGSIEGLKSDRKIRQVFRKIVVKTKPKKSMAIGKSFVSSLSDFSSDDDQPLLKKPRLLSKNLSRRGQNMAQQVKKRYANQRPNKRAKPQIMTRSRLQLTAMRDMRVREMKNKNVLETEKERNAKERKEKELKEKERKDKETKETKEKEKRDKERKEKEIIEKERREKELREKDKKDKELKEKERKEKEIKERKEKEQKEKRDKELKEKERKEKELKDQERKERELRELKEKERKEKELKELKERERKERELKDLREKERIENELKELKEKERKEKELKEREKKENELKELQEKERKEKELKERERKEKELKELKERERKEKELEELRERERKEKELKERRERELKEKERKEKEMKEKREKEAKELKEREKKERELKEQEIKERKEKELKEKDEKEKKERELKERKLKEKKEKEAQELLKKERELREKERKDKEMKEKKDRELKEKEKKDKELKEKNDKEVKEKEVQKELEEKQLKDKEIKEKEARTAAIKETESKEIHAEKEMANIEIQREEREETVVNARPTRKTKQAAAFYMELLGKSLIDPDFDDDDSYSSDSFPELPNFKRSEQRESEIKARARETNWTPYSKAKSKVKSGNTSKVKSSASGKPKPKPKRESTDVKTAAKPNSADREETADREDSTKPRRRSLRTTSFQARETWDSSPEPPARRARSKVTTARTSESFGDSDEEPLKVIASRTQSSVDLEETMPLSSLRAASKPEETTPPSVSRGMKDALRESITHTPFKFRKSGEKSATKTPKNKPHTKETRVDPTLVKTEGERVCNENVSAKSESLCLVLPGLSETVVKKDEAPIVELLDKLILKTDVLPTTIANLDEVRVAKKATTEKKETSGTVNTPKTCDIVGGAIFTVDDGPNVPDPRSAKSKVNMSTEQIEKWLNDSCLHDEEQRKQWELDKNTCQGGSVVADYRPTGRPAWTRKEDGSDRYSYQLDKFKQTVLAKAMLLQESKKPAKSKEGVKRKSTLERVPVESPQGGAGRSVGVVSPEEVSPVTMSVTGHGEPDDSLGCDLRIDGLPDDPTREQKPTPAKRPIFHRTRPFPQRPREPETNKAFSPENESSVYAFENEPEPPPVSRPAFGRRRPAPGSRASSVAEDETPPPPPPPAPLPQLGDEELASLLEGEDPARPGERGSNSIAVQVNLDTDEEVAPAPVVAPAAPAPPPAPEILVYQQSMECSTQTEEDEDEDETGHLFYIPLQPGATGANATPSGMIQGVAVKLDQTGPNQRVIMRAKLVTKPPSFNRDGIGRSLLGQPLRRPVVGSETKSSVGTSCPPVGTVQPTARAPPPPDAPPPRLLPPDFSDVPSGPVTTATETAPPGTVKWALPGHLLGVGTGGRSDYFVTPTPDKVLVAKKEAFISAVPPLAPLSYGGARKVPAPPPPAPAVRVIVQQQPAEPGTSRASAPTPAPAPTPVPVATVPQKRGPKPNAKKSEPACRISNMSTFPKPGSPAHLVEAPTFHPTEKEFQDPIEFIDRIRPLAEKFGLCRVVPPPNFKPECKVSDDMRFTAYNQYVHKTLHRWGPNVKEMMAIKKYLATQSIALTQPPWIGGMEIDLPRLYQTVQGLGGLKEVIEKKRWQRVADEMKITKSAQDRVAKLDDIYCKYLLPYETLSADERGQLFAEVEAGWKECQARVASRAGQASDDESSPDDDDDYEEECIVKGRSMPLNQFYRIARNTMSMWFRQPEPPAAEVETEFWRHVTSRQSHVCVHAGSIESSRWGYGFPVSKNSPFARHPWNLKVFTNNTGSVLRSMGPIMGVTVPTLHVGMVFTTCCWYRDPHGLPWIEYLHTGASKVWYGIPDDYSSHFRTALTKLVPRYVKNDKTIWLPSDTAMIPPPLLVDNGVSLSHAVQEPGQFVVVFPRAFTSTICTGYLVSESVYFAQPSWLSTAEQVFKDIQGSCEPSMFSLERLLFSIASDSRSNVEVLKQILPMVQNIREQELDLRKQLFALGLKTSDRLPLPEGSAKKRKVRPAQDDEVDYECEICRANLYISLVTNSHEEGVYCLPHAIELLSTKKHHLKFCKLLYTYDQAELTELIQKLGERIEAKSIKKHGKQSLPAVK